MTEQILGRDGRVITVDETQAKPLNATLNDVQHRHVLDATQPLEPVHLPRVRSEWFWDRFEVWAGRVGIVLAGLCLLAVFIAGVTRG